MADDGLKWMLDLEAKTEGPVALLAKLDQLDATLKKLDGHLDKTAEGTKHAGEGHKKHAEHAKGLMGMLERVVHQGMEPFLHKAKEIAEFEFIREGTEKLLELPGELAEKVRELGDEMLRTGAKAERASAAFKGNFGAKQGKDYEEWVDKFAHKSELAEDTVKGVALELGKVGLKAEQWKRAIEGSADLAALSKDGAEGFASAAAGYEMLARTGRVNDRVLHGLGLGQDAFFKELSDRTGDSVATLKDKIDKGKFDVNASLDTLNALITKKTGKDLGGEAMDAGGLMVAKLKNLHEAPEKILEAAKEAQGWPRLTKALGDMGDELGPEGKTGKALGDVVMGVIDKAAPLMEKLPGQIDKITESFRGMDVVLHDIAGVGHKVIEAVEVLEHFVPDSPMKAKKTDEQSVIGKITPKGGVLDDVLHAPDKASVWIAKKLFGWGEAGREGLAKGLNDNGDVHDAGGNLGKAADEGGRKALGVKSPSRKFRELGEYSVLGYIDGLDRLGGRLDASTRELFSLRGNDQSATPLPGGAGGGRGGIVTIAPEVHVHFDGARGSSDQAAAQAAAETVRDRVTDLLSSLDLLAISSGAA